jgi:hypothetical protein
MTSIWRPLSVCLVGKFGEIRPDLPVEDMLAEHVQGFALKMNSDRVANQRLEDRIDEKRDERDVIQVSMGQEYVPNPAQLVQREITCPGTTVNEHITVNQQRCGTKTGSDASATSQDSYLHGKLILTRNHRARVCKTVGQE